MIPVSTLQAQHQASVLLAALHVQCQQVKTGHLPKDTTYSKRVLLIALKPHLQPLGSTKGIMYMVV